MNNTDNELQLNIILNFELADDVVGVGLSAPLAWMFLVLGAKVSHFFILFKYIMPLFVSVHRLEFFIFAHFMAGLDLLHLYLPLYTIYGLN